MVTEQPTRKVKQEFERAGWTPGRKKGSHTMWTCPSGVCTFPLPDGHRKISPGVYRKATNALKGCDHK